MYRALQAVRRGCHRGPPVVALCGHAPSHPHLGQRRGQGFVALPCARPASSL